MFFAQNLKYLREQARESRKDIANILSVSEMTISRYESGESEPDLQKVVDLAFHFRVTVDDLLVRPKEPLFIRNIRFLQKKYGIDDKELALLMGIKKSNLKHCFMYGIENFAYCQENKSRLAEFFGLKAWELHLKDLSKEGV